MTHALAIFLASRIPPQVYSDLTLEGILPIDQDFKCDIGIEIFLYSISLIIFEFFVYYRLNKKHL